MADVLCVPLQWSGVADVHLEGKDAGKFESLKARMANEQQEYLKQLRSKAFVDRHRYTSCHPEAAHQIEVLIPTYHLPSCSVLAQLLTSPICSHVDVAAISLCMHA